MTAEEKLREIIDSTLFEAFYYEGPEADMEDLTRNAVIKMKNIHNIVLPVQKTENTLQQYVRDAYEARTSIDTANEKYLAEVCDHAYEEIKGIVFTQDAEEEREE